eukprot:g114.t1
MANKYPPLAFALSPAVAAVTGTSKDAKIIAEAYANVVSKKKYAEPELYNVMQEANMIRMNFSPPRDSLPGFSSLNKDLFVRRQLAAHGTESPRGSLCPAASSSIKSQMVTKKYRLPDGREVEEERALSMSGQKRSRSPSPEDVAKGLRSPRQFQEIGEHMQRHVETLFAQSEEELQHPAKAAIEKLTERANEVKNQIMFEVLQQANALPDNLGAVSKVRF